MGSWFYVKGGTQHGPVPWDTLRYLAGTGELKADELVWTESLKDWKPAGEVEGLFPSAVPPRIPENIPGGSSPYAPPASIWNNPQATPIFGAPLSEIVPGTEPLGVGECISRGMQVLNRNLGIIALTGLIYFAVATGAGLVLGIMDKVLGLPPFQLESQVFEAFSVPPVTTRIGEQPEATPVTPAPPDSFSSQFQRAFVQKQQNNPASAVNQLAQQILAVFLSLGCTRIGLNLVSGKQASVGMIFGEGRKLLRGVGATILYSLMIGLGFILFVVPGFYLMTRFGQYRNAIVDRDLGVIEAFKYSSEITAHNRLNLFVFWILSILIIIAGFVALCVGVFYAMPLVWVADFVVYRWLQYGRNAALDHPGTAQPLLSNTP